MMTRKQKNKGFRILLSALLLGAAMLVRKWSTPTEPTTALFVAVGLFFLSYAVIGYDILRKAALGILHGRVFDECFLMAVATLGAIALALLNGTLDFAEAVFVMLFYQIGEWFESLAVGKSRRNIAALMDIRPPYANVVNDATTEKADPATLPIGTEIAVFPGERIPLDGTVLRGDSFLDTAALTGESVPRAVHPGDSVQSGCINQSGVLYVRTACVYNDSTVARILSFVESAGTRKAHSEALIARFARIYTPVVCLSALALALFPPLFLLLIDSSPNWLNWLYRALTFLVISCPCALVISIPLSFFAGIGAASHAGILIKGSNYLESLGKVGTIVWDKTGTLTQGDFRVTEICPVGITENELLTLAATAEANSTHPIAKSICLAAHAASLTPAQPDEVQERRGEGVCARQNGKTLLAGNARFMERYGIAFSPLEKAGTVVYLACDGVFCGSLRIADTPKPTAEPALKQLRLLGVKKHVLLTGDSRKAAEQIAQTLSIDEVQSELLPDGKVAALEAIIAQSGGKYTVAFVGDGINDAPVLTRADVGVAMGGIGSDAAIEAADAVIMDDDPAKLAVGVRISRKCVRIVRENVIFALGAKAVCLLLGACGLADMWLAVFADVGVMILAVCNAIRCLKVS